MKYELSNSTPRYSIRRLDGEITTRVEDDQSFEAKVQQGAIWLRSKEELDRYQAELLRLGLYYTALRLLIDVDGNGLPTAAEVAVLI